MLFRSSLEYAREYQIQNNVRDDELTPKDYYYLLLGQYAQTSCLIDSSANRGLVVADTNSLVTKAYYDYYLKESPVQDEETDTFDNLFASILSKEKWDLILFAEPVGAYVNDGFRDMSMADEAIREFFGNRSKGLKLFNVNHSIKVLFFFFLLVPNHNRSISTYIIILSGSILVKLAQLLGNTIHFSDLLICRFCQ